MVFLNTSVVESAASGSVWVSVRVRVPAVVISSNSAIKGLRTVTVAAITRTIRAGSPLQFVLPKDRPCKDESAVVGHQVLTIDKSRLEGYIGCLDDVQLEELRRLMRIVWAL